eukprot:TRINITY_DN20484_c0_g1_i1.p1 TRINITY_DN20484_c0_g1~~TRINITY_DN20484_c0_g1_i1.p1  ORF type:complete len:243 (+),score=22.02 TRINITY_DN20484_c0_g1_i1:63-791(+)
MGGPNAGLSKATLHQIKELNKLGVSQCERPARMPLKKQQYEVKLNIYHLLGRKANSAYAKLGFGLFHTGLEINGCEYSYGDSGVFNSVPTRGGVGVFGYSLTLGTVKISYDQLNWVVGGMEQGWDADSYHVVCRNCNDFTSAMFNKIFDVCSGESDIELVREIPRHINRIARISRILPERFLDNIILKSSGSSSSSSSCNSSKSNSISSEISTPPPPKEGFTDERPSSPAPIREQSIEISVP